MKLKSYLYSLVIVLLACFPCHSTSAPNLVVGTGNPGGVRSVTFSPDGRFAVSGSVASSVMKLWEISTGREIRTIKAQSSGPGGILSVVFSPDGRSILSGGDFLEMWDIATGRRIRSFCKDDCRMFNIMSVAFSSDGQYVISGSWGNKVYLWNAATGEFIREFPHADPDKPKAHSVHINSVALSSDGRFAVSGGDDAKIKLWDVGTGKLLRTLTGHTERVTTVALSPDDRFLLSGGKKKIKLWKIATGKLVRTFGGLFSSQNYVTTLQFSPDGRRALSTNNNGEMIYWDVSTGKELHVFNKREEKKKRAAAAVFSPDGRFALQGHKGVLKLWDLSSYKLVKEMKKHADPIRALTFAPRENLVLTATRDTFKYWNFKTGREVRSFQGESYGPVFITPDGKGLFSATGRQTVVLQDGATGKVIKEFGKISSYRPHVALSPNGRYGLWNRDREAFLWDLTSGKKIHTLKGHDDLVTIVAFSPDSRFALTGGETGTLNLWEVSSGRHIRPFLTKDLGHAGGTVRAVAFSSDGQYVLSGTLDAKVRLWEVGTGKLIRVMEGKTEWLNVVALSPDGTWALAGGPDMAVKMWDCATGGLLATFTGHSSAIYTLAFSADGRYAISGGTDGVIKLYDIEKKKEIASRVHIGERHWVVYTSDGRFDGTPEGIRRVHFVQGLETFPLEAFYEKFYTPNLWVRIFDEKPFQTTEVHIAREMTTPPRVQIISPGSGAILDSEKVSLGVVIEDQGGGIDEIRLYQNGKLVSDLTHSIRDKKTAENQTTHRFDILLIPGKNEFRVVALNTNRTESKPAIVTVDFKQRPASSASLHILAIGINKYKNAVYNLNFGRPDAEAFTRALEKQGRAIFSQIVKREIYDEKAIKPVIEQEIKHLINTAGPGDVFAFFYAGHGVMSLDGTDEGADFYLITHDVTQLYGKSELLESKAISARQLKEWLKQIPAQKQVIILDACQAGGAVETFALRGAAEQKAIAQLARSTGTVVLASSGSEQFASELPELGHGLFTYALLQAISGHADGGKPPDGKITIKEIEAYINDRVPELTQQFRGSTQYPNSYTIGHDFPLAVNLQAVEK